MINFQFSIKHQFSMIKHLGHWVIRSLFGYWLLVIGYFKPARQGFSLLELIVAIALIATAVFALTSLNLKSGEGATEATLRFQATSLAREGLEVGRAMRDSNWLAGCPDPAALSCTLWNRGLFNDKDYTAVPVFEPGANTWSFDFGPDVATAVIRTDQDLLLQGAVLGAATEFSRLVELWPICRAVDGTETVLAREGDICVAEQNGIDVRSRVTFQMTGGPREVVVEERIYNWR